MIINSLLLALIIAACHANFTLMCHSTTNNTAFARGDKIPICLHVMDNVNVEAFRLTFEINVDQYTAIDAQLVYQTMYNNYSNYQTKNINNITAYNISRNVSLAVQAETNNVTSPHIPYIIKDQVITIYSLVVQMSLGVVQDIVWDDGCFGGSSNCLSYNLGGYTESNNYIAACLPLPLNSTILCDPKIYISFIGSDSNGNYMDSAGMRISRFREYSIAQMYSSAKNIF